MTNPLKDKKVLTQEEWRETIALLGQRIYYKNRPAKGFITGVPNIRPPVIRLQKNLHTNNIEIIPL